MSLDRLYKFGATTPFEFPEVEKAARIMQTFGLDVTTTGKNLELVGNIAAGVGQPFDEVATWVSRMYDAIQSGRPFGEASARLQEMGALSGTARNRIEEMGRSRASPPPRSGPSSTRRWAGSTRTAA